jgi:hypothetical protein
MAIVDEPFSVADVQPRLPRLGRATVFGDKPPVAAKKAPAV